jgi:hypothetical protein
MVRLLAFVALLSLLAGCVISGPRDLITDAEATTPLPAEFIFYPYSEQPDGTYIRNDGDKPMPFKLAGKQYDSEDGEMVLRLAPLPATSTSLLSVEGKGETDAIYGTADVIGDIVALRIILDSKLDRAAVDALPGITPELSADITLKDQGIALTRRTTLDFVIDKLRSGELKAAVLLAWIGTGQTPAKLVPDGDSYKAVP